MSDRLITINGETHNIKGWAQILGISPNTVSERLIKGIPINLPVKDSRQSICWDCINSVPNYRGNPNIGCEWSRHGKPVDGWKAVPTVLESKSWNRKIRNTYSFKVIDCPKFREG